jgi:hypothetical protein
MSETTAADRRHLAAYLLAHGPTHGRVLRDALGWDTARVWDAVYGPAGGWFTLASAGWALIDRGRAGVPARRAAAASRR